MPARNRSTRIIVSAAIGTSLALGAMVLPSLLRAQEQVAPPATAPAARRVQQDMSAMNRPFGTLRRQISDQTRNESSLALIVQMQQATVVAKLGVPTMLANLPDAEKATKIAAYKIEMNKLIRQELDLEDQLLANDNTKAAATLAAMGATEQEGHRDFQPPRRGRGGARGAGGGGATGG